MFPQAAAWPQPHKQLQELEEELEEDGEGDGEEEDTTMVDEVDGLPSPLPSFQQKQQKPADQQQQRKLKELGSSGGLTKAFLGMMASRKKAESDQMKEAMQQELGGAGDRPRGNKRPPAGKPKAKPGGGGGGKGKEEDPAIKGFDNFFMY